jgi:hypothetical protein
MATQTKWALDRVKLALTPLLRRLEDDPSSVARALRDHSELFTAIEADVETLRACAAKLDE